MTALFETPPIIVVATTDTGTRSVQFWGDLKLGTLTYKSCLVSMSHDTRGGPALTIQGQCPEGWRTRAWSLWCEFCDGLMPEPTHTVVYQFGKPAFTELTE